MKAEIEISRLRATTLLVLVRIYCYFTYPRQMMNFRREVGYWPDPAFPATSNEKYT